MFSFIKLKYNQFLINHLYGNLSGSRYFARKRKCMGRLGHTVADTARIMGPLYSMCRLHIGEDTFVGTMFRCEGNGIVTIGDRCDIAPQVTILTGTHAIGDENRRAGKGITRNTTIGDGCWLGARCMIMPGIQIGNGCIVAAGALVTKNMPDNSIAKGVPAVITPIE